VALLPLFAVIGLAIKINSKGPVFYRARAIGKNGVEFKMFKFRSMRVNNDAGIHKEFVTKLIKGEIGQKTDGDCPKPLKITNDPRITWIGGLLRKYSLDELPQLINVLLGQMSLIGPRPCLPYEFDVYQDWYKKRAAIRPGITGLWQVAGRSEVAFEEMILLDLYYLYNRSLWMDINLVIETVFVVLSKEGGVLIGFLGNRIHLYQIMYVIGLCTDLTTHYLCSVCGHGRLPGHFVRIQGSFRHGKRMHQLFDCPPMARWIQVLKTEI
jgi:lipopolysaccharide/colanic/teichoic acid biosynthesis glycosyltransferase